MFSCHGEGSLEHPWQWMLLSFSFLCSTPLFDFAEGNVHLLQDESLGAVHGFQQSPPQLSRNSQPLVHSQQVFLAEDFVKLDRQETLLMIST